MDVKKFNNDVKYYKSAIKDIKRNVAIFFDSDNEDAYYSTAALTKALHDKKIDVNVSGGKDFDFTKKIVRIWDAYRNKTDGYKELKEFIDAVEKKLDKKLKGQFRNIFEMPLFIIGMKDGFYISDNFFLPDAKRIDIAEKIEYRYNWLDKKKFSKLKQTGTVIWKQVFNLRKDERISIAYDLVHKENKAPMNDLLDNFIIGRAMYESAKKFTRFIGIGSSTSRDSILDLPEPVSELKATIMGCEYEKDINEPIFKIYKKLSKKFKISFKRSSAVMGIFGEGYSGRHFFGQAVGYPTKNRKSRWTSPGQMFYKFSWYPQSMQEERDPISRVGFTSTIPADDFILTCNIDWMAMSRKNRKIANAMNKSEEVHVESRLSNFIVKLTNKKKRRHAFLSDVDIRDKYDKEFYKNNGIKTGTMANLPGGEAFVTPESLTGRIVGDVVINIDDSYMLNGRTPLIIDAKLGRYKVISGPEKVLKKIKEKKRDAWAKIKMEEKSGSLPKSIVEMKKDNFDRIGEFAVNTHPKAKLSRYLIINEKIAGMIHVAIGSGFEQDRNTEYHWDIVINAKKQKMDIYGLDSKGKKHWIMKKGKLV